MRFSGFGRADPGTSSQEVLDGQGKLVQLGYTLSINGSYDAATSAAVLDFKSKMGYPVVDAMDADFATALGMAGRPEYIGRFKGSGMSTGAMMAVAFFGSWIVWKLVTR